MGSRTVAISPAAAAPAAAPAVLHPAIRPKPAFYLAFIFVFVVFARFPEIMDTLVGTGLHSARIMLLLSLLATVLSGALLRAAFSKVGICMLGFTAWFCLAIFLSVWRGGSFKVLKDEWLFSILAFLIVAAAVKGLHQCRRIMYSLAAATVFIEATTVILGRLQQGRLALLSGTLANANFLAMILLMGLPFCVFVIQTRPGISLLKIACLVTLCLAPVTIVGTGSRGGLLTMLTMFLLYFWRLPALQKAAAVAAVLLLGVIAVSRSSQSALVRYKTIFNDSETASYLSMDELSAMESAQSRKVLLMNSLELTMQHPLFGVGPGMFQVANAQHEEQKGRGSWTSWHETHNAFTQISSEDGVPALLLYSAALFFSFRIARMGRKLARKNPACAALEGPAFALRLSLIAFVGSAVFTSIAYQYYFPLIAGLCVALERAMPEVCAAAGGATGPERA